MNVLRGVLFPLYTIQFVLVASINTINPVISLYAISLGASIGLASVVVASFNVASALAMIPFGMLADRVGKGRLLYASSIMAIVGPLLCYMAPDLTTLVLARIVHGFCFAIFLPVSWSITMDLARRGSYGRSIGTIGAALQLGTFLGPLMGGFFGGAFGYRNVFLLASAMVVPDVLLTWVAIRRLVEKAPHAYVVRKRGRDAPKSAPIMRRNFVAAMVAPLAMSVGGAVFSSLIPIYLVDKLHELDAGGVGIILATSAIGQVFVRGLLSSVSDKYGRRIVIVTGLFLVGLAIAAITFRTDFYFMLIVAVLSGTGMALVIPAGAALATDSVPIERRGMGMGSFQTFLNVGPPIGATWLGYLAEGTTFNYAFTVAAAVEIGGALCTIFFIKRATNSQAAGEDGGAVDDQKKDDGHTQGGDAARG